jgi:hypothetical protein
MRVRNLILTSVKVKSVDGSNIETTGTLKTVVNVDSLKIPFMFQLVSKQVDIPCDGILGRDFLENAGATISYASGTLTVGTGSNKFSKTVADNRGESNQES